MTIAATIQPSVAIMAQMNPGIWDQIYLQPKALTDGIAGLAPLPPTRPTNVQHPLFRRYDTPPSEEDTSNGIRWRVYSNDSGIHHMSNDYRIYLNPDKPSYTKTLELLLRAMKHPWFPSAAFKCIEEDPKDLLGHPDSTKIVMYFHNPAMAATAAWLIRGATSGMAFLSGASILSDTIPINNLIQSLGGRREHQRLGYKDVLARNQTLVEALALRGLIQ